MPTNRGHVQHIDGGITDKTLFPHHATERVFFCKHQTMSDIDGSAQHPQSYNREEKATFMT